MLLPPSNFGTILNLFDIPPICPAETIFNCGSNRSANLFPQVAKKVQQIWEEPQQYKLHSNGQLWILLWSHPGLEGPRKIFLVKWSYILFVPRNLLTIYIVILLFVCLVCSGVLISRGPWRETADCCWQWILTSVCVPTTTTSTHSWQFLVTRVTRNCHKSQFLVTSVCWGDNENDNENEI